MTKNRFMPLLALFALFATSTTSAADVPNGLDSKARVELWLATTSWPALGDIQPVAGGSFDSTGYGLGAAIHAQFREFENSELLIGFDAWIDGTDSNITGPVETLFARHLYIGSSLKWLVGASRTFSLDTGVGCHLTDMAQVNTNYGGWAEFESWEKSRLGGFVGASWDFGRRRPEKRMGMFLSMKVHYVDFGRVYDEDILIAPLLGPNAGSLDGPIYMLQFGVAGR